VEDFAVPGDFSTQEICSLLGALTYETKRTLDLPRHGASRACPGPGCHRRQLLGPFEEDDEGIGIASDVVKVEDEDPATPRSLSEVC